MPSELRIDRAIYLVDHKAKSYRFLRRNPHWRKLDQSQNERNKRTIDGYTRIFRNGRRKTFNYSGRE
jgi:hypothetical protein